MREHLQRFMANFRQSMANFMVGRYGVDYLSRFLSFAALAVMLVGCFTVRWLYYIGLALLIYSYFRVFSRNYAARSAENQKFLTLRYKWSCWIDQKKKRFEQRKTYRYYRCPHCKQELRVPRGKGRISICCPKCSTNFIKKT